MVFCVLPISLTGIISLISLDYRFRWDFVGLTNFLALLQDAIIPRVLLNTGVYVFTADTPRHHRLEPVRVPLWLGGVRVPRDLHPG